MSEEEKARIGELVVEKQAANRHLSLQKSKAENMASNLRCAMDILVKASTGERPSYTKLDGFPDRVDVERLLSDITRDTDTITNLSEKLNGMGVVG